MEGGLCCACRQGGGGGSAIFLVGMFLLPFVQAAVGFRKVDGSAKGLRIEARIVAEEPNLILVHPEVSANQLDGVGQWVHDLQGAPAEWALYHHQRLLLGLTIAMVMKG